ncbi:MAG TPA: nitroreductase family protein [Bacteroidales bacterium]|nr:nitroreductase family protein [Bacteroidales bacterium]
MGVLQSLVLKNRSYRRFKEDENISSDFLKELVSLASITPSGRNAQPLKYVLINTPETNLKVFNTLSWAAYLKGKGAPNEGERPSAYIVILLDKHISENPFCDHGIVAQTMLLGAVEKGYGGCMIMNIKKEELSNILNLPEHFEILMVIALGKPIEQVVLETMPQDGNFQYWRDEQQVHHVPKRSVNELILKIQ